MNIQTEDFLTIDDAVKFTRTSESTVRRFVRSLSDKDKGKYIRREGKRLFIAKTALQDAFDLLPGIEDTKEVELVAFQRQALQEASRMTSRLQEQNERLFSEVQKANEDLKTAWSLIDNLKSEVYRLTSEVKRLEAPSGDKDNHLFIFAVALSLLAIAFIVWYIA
jgi:DNA-binding transcriptional regulator GbsR (MarR family)